MIFLESPVLAKPMHGIESAVLIIKPHCGNSERIAQQVIEVLKSHSMRIVQSGSLSSMELTSKKFVQSFFVNLSKLAESPLIRDVHLTNEGNRKFDTYFGASWSEMVKSGRVFTFSGIKIELNINDFDVNDLCSSSKKPYCRLQEGVYCAMLDYHCTEDFELQDKLHIPIYVINGFYGVMKKQYENKNTILRYMCIEWDGSKLSWPQVHNDVVGCKDPSLANQSTIRGSLFKQWKQFGFTSIPNAADNFVHLSGSAFRAFADRLIVVSDALIYSDVFGYRLINKAKIPSHIVQKWLTNPLIAGESVFNRMNLLNSFECISEAEQLLGSHTAYI